MDYFRHKNGNGKKYNDAEVVASMMDADSYAGEGSHIYGSNLYSSGIKGMDITNCDILKVTALGTGILANCRISNTVIRGNVRLKGSEIKDSQITGKVTVTGAFLTKCIVADEVIIDPDAHCSGIGLQGRMRVGPGVWTVPPKYTEIETDNGSSFGVTEAKNGWAYIGCTPKPMATWIKKRKLWAKLDKWDRETREALKLTFEEWLDGNTV